MIYAIRMFLHNLIWEENPRLVVVPRKTYPIARIFQATIFWF